MFPDPQHHRAWLYTASRDTRVPGNAFKLAFALERESRQGRLVATTAQLQECAGIASYLTARASLDRLAACGYVRYKQGKSHSALDIELITSDPQSYIAEDRD